MLQQIFSRLGGFALLATVALTAVPAAQAQDLKEFGTASGWDVLIDPDKNMGCLIQAEFENGALVRIGFDKNKGGGYVTAFNHDWGGIEEGVVYPILFDLDGQEYEGEGTSMFLGDTPGIEIEFDNLDLFLDIMKKNVLSLFNENGLVMEISLEGTFNAMDFATECQAEVDANR
jgi:hypothetical protein